MLEYVVFLSTASTEDTMGEPNSNDLEQLSSELLTNEDLEYLRKSAIRAKSNGLSRKEFLKLCGTKEAHDYVKTVWKSL